MFRITDFLLSEGKEANNKGVRLVILTGKKDLHHPNNLYKTAGKFVEKCKERGIKYFVAYSDSCYIAKKEDEDKWFIYNSGDEKGFELNKENTVVLTRKSVANLQFSLDTLSQIEKRDIYVINSRDCIEKCNDKYRTILLLNDAGVQCPKTALVADQEMLDIAIDKVGGRFPVVMKTISGSKGIGVFKAESIESLKSTLQAIWKMNPSTEILMQEYIGSDGDIRVHVLGGKVIGAMKRLRISGDFRSNYSLGSEIEKIKLTDEQKEMAILASKAVGGIWTGVDIIQSGKQNYVIEVNSSPGTEGIEKITGKDIVGKVLDYITDRNKWVKQTREIGYIKTITIEEFVNLKAKMDTGNGSYCVIHTDKVEIKDGKAFWTYNGKEYSHPYIGNKKVKIRGIFDKYDERPIIKLDVTFGGVTYKDVPFTLANRGNMSTPVLMNREFIKRANLSINPQKRYSATIKENIDKLLKEINEINDLEYSYLEGRSDRVSEIMKKAGYYSSLIRDVNILIKESGLYVGYIDRNNRLLKILESKNNYIKNVGYYENCFNTPLSFKCNR